MATLGQTSAIASHASNNHGNRKAQCTVRLENPATFCKRMHWIHNMLQGFRMNNQVKAFIRVGNLVDIHFWIGADEFVDPAAGPGRVVRDLESGRLANGRHAGRIDRQAADGRRERVRRARHRDAVDEDRSVAGGADLGQVQNRVRRVVHQAGKTPIPAALG